MGSSSQLYSLSWGEFSSSLASAVQLLRGHGDLVDVTLAAGGRSFPAHKIVLCAASPFLLDLLKSTPCQHPVVMLAGVEADDLELLLEFVYRGEVSVEPSQLPSLLQAAHCLSIHGLTPPTILTENGEEVPVSAIPATNDSFNKETANSCLPIRRRKKRRKSTCGKWQRAVGAAEVEHKEMEIDDSRTRYQKEEEATNHSDSGEGQSKGRTVSDQPTTCPLCGAILRQSRNLRRHLELLHFGSSNKSIYRKIERHSDLSNYRLLKRAAEVSLLRSSENVSGLLCNTNSSTSNSSIPGKLPSTMLGCNNQSHPGILAASNASISMGPPNNGIYSENMINCLLPPLPSVNLTAHNAFRHDDFLRAGVYQDAFKQMRHERSDLV
ncbi:transcription activator GAGA-like isoform X2 [Prorops nasuta]|uniref:transcription activator GAGA-like isoform X2 n=1 Tax=Prorops nasuta TaxID=863751 RepID=UPI0034CF4BB6